MSPSGPTLITLGCRLNIAESETIRALAHGRDVAVVNGCGVTNRAVKDTRAAIRRLRRQRPGAELVVTGCASDMDRAAFAAMPEVDRIVPNAAKQLPESWRGADGRAPNMAPPRAHTRGFVAVQTGCDHACTFCAIPAGRGASRSDAIPDIVPRVAALVAAGQREIVLSGVDLTSYADRGQPLAALVEALLVQVPALARLRLSSLDPAEVDDRLFALLTQEARVTPHVHLSAQAGDDLILKRMRRRHSRRDMVRLVDRLKTARADIAIGADLIAGFPTESDAAFANTLALVADCAIVHAHVFPYSPRDGTPAARMPQVAPDVARRRAATLRDAAAAHRATWLKGLIGTTQPVVIEKPGDRGHAPNFAEVRLAAHDQTTSVRAERTRSPSAAHDLRRRSGRVEIGDIVPVAVTAATDTHLTGHIA
ncbi:2-methylthioadenine synthase [Sphingomonas sp. Leaf412]|nr:2-methylthioadenine synthase [Sphingomonas sp. Leaf412]